MSAIRAELWESGEKSRPLMVVWEPGFRFTEQSFGPCVGFLTGSDESGRGFTIYIGDEEEFRRVEEWVQALTEPNRRVFVKTIIRRPRFAFAESGL